MPKGVPAWNMRCDACIGRRKRPGPYDDPVPEEVLARRCRNWAVPGKKRCAMHGGDSTSAKTPEGKAARTAALVEGRKLRIAILAMQGKKIAVGHRGGRPRKDGSPPKNRSAPPFLTGAKYFRAQAAAWVAGQAEIRQRRELARLVVRGASAAGKRDAAAVTAGQDAAAELRRRWREDDHGDE
jgi:hypothetical protein